MRIESPHIRFAFLLFTILVNAQDDPSKFRIGVSLGLEKNISSRKVAFGTYIGYLADYDKFNYKLGLVTEYWIKSKLAITTGLKYSNKDFTGTYFCDVCDFEVPPVSENVDFTFIEVPISLRFYFLPRKVRPFVEAGTNNLFSLNNPGALNYLGYESRINTYTFGLKMGGGIEYKLGQNTSLQAVLDYSSTLSKLFKDSYYREPGFRLRSLYLGIEIVTKL